MEHCHGWVESLDVADEERSSAGASGSPEFSGARDVSRDWFFDDDVDSFAEERGRVLEVQLGRIGDDDGIQASSEQRIRVRVDLSAARNSRDVGESGISRIRDTDGLEVIELAEDTNMLSAHHPKPDNPDADLFCHTLSSLVLDLAPTRTS